MIEWLIGETPWVVLLPGETRGITPETMTTSAPVCYRLEVKGYGYKLEQMDYTSQSSIVSLFPLFSRVTSSNLEYYGIVKTDINTIGCGHG